MMGAIRSACEAGRDTNCRVCYFDAPGGPDTRPRQAGAPAARRLAMNRRGASGGGPDRILQLQVRTGRWGTLNE
jgi:hypothetical protein